MILELKGISKGYKISTQSKQQVLTDVSLELPKGQMITIVGPSGSGKSTLLNIIGTLDTPDNGTVTLMGNDLTSLNQNQLAEFRNIKLGFIFQSHQLLPQLSLIENVLLPTLPQNKKFKLEARKRSLELLNFVGLSDHIHKFPGQLSGGECQRVAVVRALINNPDLLLADEPTGSLDENTADDIGKLLVEINKEHGTSMIVVTHSIRLARIIGNIHNLNNGSLTEVS